MLKLVNSGLLGDASGLGKQQSDSLLYFAMEFLCPLRRLHIKFRRSRNTMETTLNPPGKQLIVYIFVFHLVHLTGWQGPLSIKLL